MQLYCYRSLEGSRTHSDAYRGGSYDLRYFFYIVKVDKWDILVIISFAVPKHVVDPTGVRLKPLLAL